MFSHNIKTFPATVHPAAPSSPTRVSTTQISPSSLDISWSPETGKEVLGYEVFILNVETENVVAHDVPDPSTVSLVLMDLQQNTVYKVWLVSYGQHLPSPPTEPIDVKLNGMIPLLKFGLKCTIIYSLCICFMCTYKHYPESFNI